MPKMAKRVKIIKTTTFKLLKLLITLLVGISALEFSCPGHMICDSAVFNVLVIMLFFIVKNIVFV